MYTKAEDLQEGSIVWAYGEIWDVYGVTVIGEEVRLDAYIGKFVDGVYESVFVCLYYPIGCEIFVWHVLRDKRLELSRLVIAEAMNF